MRIIFKLFLCFMALTGASTAFAQPPRQALKTITTQKPESNDDDIFLKLPDRYYYFKTAVIDGNKGQQLHCYYPNAGKDVTLDLSVLWGWRTFIDASWHDKANDNAYFAINDGGTEVRELTVYKITKDNAISEVMKLNGYLPRPSNDYDYSNKCAANAGPFFVHIEGYNENDTKVDALYNFDLTPATLLSVFKSDFTPRDLGFVRINTDGVNIRKAPNARAPRWGYFYCAQCEGTDYENPLLWEDDPEGQKPFTPFHPEKGALEYYLKSNSTIAGWHPLHNDKYISDKFVDEVTYAPITLNTPIDLYNTIMIKQGKYAGLCIFMEEDGMYDGALYFGKLDKDGIIQFFGMCSIPHHNDTITGLKKIDDDFYFGSEYAAGHLDWGMQAPLDLSKLTTNDLDFLMGKAKLRGIINGDMIIAGFPGRDKQFFYLH